MKKVISILLILTFILSTITTLANTIQDEVFDILFNANYLSGEVEATMVLKANAPLPKFMDNDGNQTKMLSDLKYTYDIKFNMSEDNKKMQLEMDMNMAMPQNEPMDIKYWLDLDFSNAEEPVFKMIMKTPEDDRYMYMDYINTNEDFASIPNIENVLDMDKINQTNEEFINNIDKSKVITEYDNGKYKIVLDERTIKDLYKNIALSMSDIFSNIQTLNPIPFNLENNNDETLNPDFEQTIIDFFDKIEDIQLFDKDAVIMEVELDDDNLIKNQKMTINIKTNIAKIMEAFNAPAFIIPKEDSDIDISFIMDMNYNNINEQIDIILPELTEDNSINMLENMHNIYQQTFEISEDDINIVVNNQKLDFDVEPIIQENEVLVPLRAFLKSINISDNNIGYDNGVVTIKYGNDIIEFSIDSDIAYLNNKAFTLDMPVIEIGGRTLLPAELIAEMFECDIFWTPFYNNENEIISAGILEFTSKRQSTIEIMVSSDTDIIDEDILNKVSNMIGINAKIVKVPVENYKEKAMLMIAAGEPAVFFGPNLEGELLSRFTKQGVMVRLDQLIERYAPNIQSFIEANPEYRKKITDGNEHIYMLPFITDDVKETESIFFMTATINNPQTALKWFDYFYTEDGQELMDNIIKGFGN